jgi:curved DNA-binding protein
MDYYSVLGVTKSANQDDIKRAYRKLAMQHHPDKGGDEAKFKQINEAYSALGDPAKRAEYDNPQTHSFNFNNTHFDFNDIFSQAFGGGGRRQRANRDVTIAVTLDLEDVVKGKKLVARYALPSGKIEESNIDIPPGVDQGLGIRFEGLGDNSISHLPRGDLIVRIKIKNHPVWRREGRDLFIIKKIDIFDCMLGTTVEIETLDNKRLQVTIPPGTQPNAVFNLPGYGISDIRTGTSGNAYMQISATVPKISDANILIQLESIRNEISNITK